MIYGGGRMGIMGIVADAAIAAGGRVEGVIPDFLLQWEVAHTGLGALWARADLLAAIGPVALPIISVVTWPLFPSRPPFFG